MVFHQIQCPNCFTEYAISDEQYQTSGSMIRCGVCRGQYEGILLSESATKPAFDPRKVFIEPSLDSQGDNDDSLDLQLPGEPEPVHVSQKTPPTLNEDMVELFSSNEDDLDIETTSLTISETAFAADFEKTTEIEIFDELDTNPNADDISDELSTSEILRNLRKRSANDPIESKTNSNSIKDDISISIEPKLENESHKQSVPDQASFKQPSFKQQELEIDIELEPSTLIHDELNNHVVLNDHDALKGRDALENDAAPNKDFSLTKDAPPKIEKALKDDVLIDQVDKLVDEKLLGTVALANKEVAVSNEESDAKQPKPRRQKLRTKNPRTKNLKQEKSKKGSGDNDDDFFLEPRNRRVKKKNSFFGFMGFILKALLLLILLIVLIYQFWLKQFIELPNIDSLPNHPWFDKAEDFVTPHIETAKQQLERHNITLPDRRDLEQLELLSAQTFPHPEQATRVLLKVSFINRATISQPLPWLEMSLTDTEGRLVSRRNLSPDDYIYNNKTNLEIGPNELKKITIELLSFPKSATGYEIKLLSN